MYPTLAHAFSGPAGGASSLLYLVAAGSAFIFLEARDRRRTADDPASLDRRVRVAATVGLIAIVLGTTAQWWFPGAREYDRIQDEKLDRSTGAWSAEPAEPAPGNHALPLVGPTN